MDGNGSPIFVKASSKPVFAANGEFRGYRGTGTDVTAILRAQGALRESTEAQRRSESYLAEAQRLSHTGTWAFNPTTTLYWSEENYRIWGLDPLKGLPSREAVWQRIHPDDRGRVYQGAMEALRQKSDYAVEFRIVLPDGTVKYLEASSRHLFSERGELAEVVGTHVDVTERNRAQEERERLRQLEANLAHMNRLSIMGNWQPRWLMKSTSRSPRHATTPVRPRISSTGTRRTWGRSGQRSTVSWAMPIELGTSSPGSGTTLRKRLHDRTVLISIRRSTR